jgi:mannitol/fructose-specific phosphotransferase system IIA component (Ntr-type)
MAVPATEAAVYLRLLAGLSRLAQREELLLDLLRAEDAEEMIQPLAQVRLELLGNRR